MFDFNEFANPSAQYRSAPFWSLNGELEEKELRRQIQQMHAQGMGGFFMHPRGGMKTEYLSEVFMAAIGACIDEAKKLNMHAWLYDEDRFPSGGAGGLLTKNNKDYAAKTLEMKSFDTYEEAKNTPHEKIFCCAAGTYTDVTGQSDVAGAKANATWLTFTLSSIEPSPLWNNEYYGDILNSEAMDAFIEITHEKYKSAFGDNFGKAVPGIFTDEPFIHVKRDGLTRIAWTTALENIFKSKKSYSILNNVYKLFFDVGDYLQVRYDYWDVVSTLFVQNFAEKVGKWCDENNLKFTGHFWEHDFPSPLLTGSTMPNYVPMQYPGIDLLFNTEHYIGQYGNVFIAKELTSIKNQFGKERVLSETYGASGWELNFINQKRICDWQFVLGIDFVCQHLVHYSLEGFRKRDFPLSFCDRQPWWDEYKLLGDYIGRMSYVISSGTEISDILVLHPAHSVFMSFNNIGENAVLEKIDRSIKWLTKSLCEIQFYYDLGDETVMQQHARVEGNYLHINKKKYKTIIIPYITNLNKNTFNLLNQFINNGGNIISLNTGPVMLEGKFDNALNEFVQHPGIIKIAENKKQLKSELNKLNNLGCNVIDTIGGDISDIYICEREIDGKTALFIVNTSKQDEFNLKIRKSNFQGISKLDCFTGEASAYPVFNDADGVYWTVFLAPVESALFMITPDSTDPVKTPVLTDVETIIINTHDFTAKRTNPNALTLQSVKYRLNNTTPDAPWSAEMNVVAAFDQIRSALGFEPGHIFGRQPWMYAADDYKTTATLEAQYIFNTDFIPDTIEAALENPDNGEVYVNGKKVNPTGAFYVSREFIRYDIQPYVGTGENTIIIKNTNFNINSVLESMYIIGDFALDADKDFTLIKEEKIKAGDWTKTGYPFYSGEMCYSNTFNVNSDYINAVLKLNEIYGVAVIYINNKKIKSIAFPPFELDITDFIKPGENKIEIKIKNSAQNLLGPHDAECKGLVTPGSFYLKGKAYYFDPSGLCGDCEIKIKK